MHSPTVLFLKLLLVLGLATTVSCKITGTTGGTTGTTEPAFGDTNLDDEGGNSKGNGESFGGGGALTDTRRRLSDRIEELSRHPESFHYLGLPVPNCGRRFPQRLCDKGMELAENDELQAGVQSLVREELTALSPMLKDESMVPFLSVPPPLYSLNANGDKAEKDAVVESDPATGKLRVLVSSLLVERGNQSELNSLLGHEIFHAAPDALNKLYNDFEERPNLGPAGVWYDRAGNALALFDPTSSTDDKVVIHTIPATEFFKTGCVAEAPTSLACRTEAHRRCRYSGRDYISGLGPMKVTATEVQVACLSKDAGTYRRFNYDPTVGCSSEESAEGSDCDRMMARVCAAGTTGVVRANSEGVWGTCFESLTVQDLSTFKVSDLSIRGAQGETCTLSTGAIGCQLPVRRYCLRKGYPAAFRLIYVPGGTDPDPSVTALCTGATYDDTELVEIPPLLAADPFADEYAGVMVHKSAMRFYDPAILKYLLASEEYAVRHVHAADFAEGLFRDLLGREPELGEAAPYAEIALTDRLKAATEFMNSKAFLDKSVKSQFVRYYRRVESQITPEDVSEITDLNLDQGNQTLHILMKSEYHPGDEGSDVFVKRVSKNITGEEDSNWQDAKNKITDGLLSREGYLKYLLRSPKLADKIVIEYFSLLFGRTPNAKEREEWVQLGPDVDNGLFLVAVPEIMTSFATSPEYMGKYDADPDNISERYVRALYRDFLNREPKDANEIAAGRADPLIAKHLLAGTEYRKRQISFLYQTFLKRRDMGVYAHELEFWANKLQTEPTYNLSQLTHEFMSSNEYVNEWNHKTDVSFVKGVYRDLLRRDPTPGEIDEGKPFFPTQAQRKAFVKSVMKRDEIADSVINSYYFHILRRKSDGVNAEKAAYKSYIDKF